MKLSFEQRAVLNEVARHFIKIEEIAFNMGIELDSLFEKCNAKFHPVDEFPLPRLATFTNSRRRIFLQDCLLKTRSAFIVNLDVMVNENQFRLLK